MTIEELKAEVVKNPNLLKEIIGNYKTNAVEHLEADGMIVRTKEQDDQHVSAQIDQQLPEKVKAGVAKEYGKTMYEVDAQLTKILGIPKKPEEKTTDYAKRAADEVKKAKGGEVDNSVYEQRIADLTNEKTELQTKYDTDQARHIEELQDFSLVTELSARKYNIPTHLTDKEKQQAYVEKEKNMISTDFKTRYKAKKDEKGITYYDKEGKPMLSKKDGKPFSHKDLLDQDYADRFLPTKRQQGGSGAEEEEGGGAGGGTGKLSREAAHKSLADKGLAAGTKEYVQEYSKMKSEGRISD